MANKREVAKLNRKLLSGSKNREQVAKALKVFDDFYADCNTRGMAVIDRMAKTWGEYTLIFEVEQWSEEKAQNTFDYTLAIVNGDGEVVYDEADGELPLSTVVRHFNNINKPRFY